MMNCMKRSLHRKWVSTRCCTRTLSSSSAAMLEIPSPTTTRSSRTTTTEYAPIYVAATRQHVGKTTVSLALVSGLSKRFEKVGFIKPVGQVSLTVPLDNGQTIQVDKDAVLIKNHFHLDHLHFPDTSPVLIPPGYTRDFLDGKITENDQKTKIQHAYHNVANASGIVLCEGTGHVAVGSIIEANNADIASLLGAKMVLVANGGCGRSFDELQLNYMMCQSRNVEIAGVIINKVKPEKYEQTRHYLSLALERYWGPDIPVLGCIPDRPFLGCPALADLERLLDASLVSGTQHRLRHYRVQDLTLVGKSLEAFLKDLREKRNSGGRTLYVCHASRNDILLGYLMESVNRAYHGRNDDDPNHSWETAMLVTGCDDYPISTQILEIITSLKNAPPVLLTNAHTDHAMHAIYGFTPKLNSEDGNRVAIAVQHYEPYIDFEKLLERVDLGTNVQVAQE